MWFDSVMVVWFGSSSLIYVVWVYVLMFGLSYDLVWVQSRCKDMASI